MKAMHQILICLFVVMAIVYSHARPDDSASNIFSKSLTSGDKYPAKFDRVNVDDILKSDRLLNNYFNCLLGEARCTADGKEFKIIVPEALATDCQKCTEKQAENVTKLVVFLITKRPDMWERLTNKYDPEKKYKYKYEEEVKKLTAAAN